MTDQQSGKSPSDRVESKNGWSVNHKPNKISELQTVSTYGSGIKRPRFASDLDRRKHKVELSLFPKFNGLITKTDTCWLWMAGLDAYGYGQIARRGFSPIKTHRLAWIFAHGPIPKGAHVLHRCDVRNCVNPDHLFLGDQAANMKDAAAKGRLSYPHRKRPFQSRPSPTPAASLVTPESLAPHPSSTAAGDRI